MSRRDQIRMTDDEIREFLLNGHTIIIATNGPRGFPHAMPMFYGIDDDLTVRIATYESSQKVKNIERDARVTLLIETGSAYDELRGVMMYGEAEISKDLDATVETMIEAMDATQNEMPEVSQIPEAVKRGMAGKRVLLRIRPQRFVSWDHGKLPKAETPAGLQ